MDHHQGTNMPPDSTVRSQDSNNSSDSKDTKTSKMTDSTGTSKDSKPESCQESKHSKEVLIDTRRPPQDQQRQPRPEPRDDSNILMFTSCGQLLLGVVLVVFGVLTLVHGASLGNSGAGLWAGAGSLVAGALGVVATLATTGGQPTSGFPSAHLAASLVALALSNMAAITALTAVVRDSQRSVPDLALISLGDDMGMDEGWAGLLASIGLLIVSIAELFVSGYTCVTLAPKLCGCLRPNNDEDQVTVDGKTLKTRNMVHQWVIAQNHVPKNQPIYVVQPVVPMHPIMQPAYGMHPPPGKFAGGYLTPVPAPPPGAAAYGPVPMLPAHVAYPARPPSQIVRSKQSQQQQQQHHHLQQQQQQQQHQQHQQQQQRRRRHSSDQSDSGGEASRQRRSRDEQARKPMASIGEDQLQQDLSRTYTGLDKRISEEFISIAMDPERKSKASSHHGSESGARK